MVFDNGTQSIYTTVLKADKITFHYKNKVPILVDISFDCKKGKLLGLLGHNGSGKTTLLKILGRLIPPVSGNVYLENNEYSEIPEKVLYNKIGLLIEEPVFYNHLSLLDNLKIIASYRGIPALKIEQALTSVEAISYLKKKAGNLSTGMRQRAGLAAILMSDPEVILLDEPTNGLDPEGMIKMREILLDLKKDGKTLVISSHILSELEKISDDILILRNGKTLFQDSVDAIRNYRDLEDLYISLKII